MFIPFLIENLIWRPPSLTIYKIETRPFLTQLFLEPLYYLACSIDLPLLVYELSAQLLEENNLIPKLTVDFKNSVC